jgi:hypothetical protein
VEFHETDVGKFHRALSIIVLAVALVFSAGGAIAWWNKPGQRLLIAAAAIGLVLVWGSLRGLQAGEREFGNQSASGLDRNTRDGALRARQ